MAENKSAAPRVSVIIPTYNRGDLLCLAIDSVLKQSFRDYELIVVDDGSTDGTASLIRSYLDRITYIVQANGGVAAARNNGIRASHGAFLAFLDSDDLWRAEKLELQVRFADANPQYGLIATEISSFNERGRVPARTKATMYPIKNGMVVEDLLFANWIQTSTVLVRRECLEHAGAFDEGVGQFGEDWLLWMHVASRFPIYFMPEPLVDYRVHEENLTSHKPEAQFESLMQILDKLRGLPQFQKRPELIETAEYRISLVRGCDDVNARAFDRAIPKLQRACSLKRVPVKAAALLMLATIGNKFARANSPTG